MQSQHIFSHDWMTRYLKEVVNKNLLEYSQSKYNSYYFLTAQAICLLEVMRKKETIVSGFRSFSMDGKFVSVPVQT